MMKLTRLAGIMALAVGSACGAPQPELCNPAGAAVTHTATTGSALFAAGATETLYLVGCPSVIVGDPGDDERSRMRFDAEALREWAREATKDGVRITSPDLRDRVPEASRIRVVLAPGGATQVRLTPILSTGQTHAFQRMHRTLHLGLERDAEGSELVAFAADLREVSHGNWDDHGLEGALVRLEIELPGARVDAVTLDEVVIEGPDAIYAAAPAAAQSVDHGGLIRPAWYTTGGSLVRLAIRVPPAPAVLHWHDGALEGTGIRTLRVVAGGGTGELWRGKGSSPWRHQSVSLDRWSGQTVVIELETSHGGVGFFGDPRIVSGAADESPPRVVLYMIDTLRADRLGAWGGADPRVSPVIDALAREGVMFRNAISSSPWTKPAIPTLLTGVWPTTHKVGSISYADLLPASVPMLQERFRQAGWRTGSFSSSPLGSTLSALERGFSVAAPPRFWRGAIGPVGHPSADQLHAALLDWLDEEPTQPAFAYVHTMEVHEYLRALYTGGGAKGLQAYDAAIRDADRKLGALLEALRSRAREGELLLVVVSDHGRSFGRHGVRGHGTSLFQAQIHIPLLFWGRGQLPARVVDEPVGLPDLAPTLLDLAGLPALPEADGKSLAATLLGAGVPRVHEYVASALLRFVWWPDAPQQFALVSHDLRKLIERGDGHYAGFDLAQDPAETKPVMPKEDLSASLRTWMRGQEIAARAFEARHGQAAEVEVDAGDAERLRDLGYLE